MDKNFIADRVRPLQASAIREIFKMVGQSDIISFAGGNPSSEIFPEEELARLANDIIKNEGVQALQYGVTEGYAPLRNYIIEEMKKEGIMSESDGCLITTGGQQVIDFCAKSLINEGDVVAVEAPSFIGGLNALRSYGGRLVGIEMEDDGLDTVALEELAKKEKIKLLYTIPTFQNPTGITMSLEKRKEVLRLAEKYDFYILEDNPYGKLRFSGEDVPAIKTMDTTGRVIYASSYSKLISPGMRIGYGIMRHDIFDRMVVCKQASDVHTPCLTQMMVYRFVTEYDFEKHIKKSIDMYREKCKLMTECIDRYFPDNISHTNPEGGIFLWCRFDKDVDTKEIMKSCVENKVVFVPGATAMVDIDKKCNMFRLNYSTPTLSQIEQGMKIMGDVLKSV